MGDMYVPNIQRPGFGYKRYNDEEEDGSDDSYGGGTPASDGGETGGYSPMVPNSPMASNSPAQGMQSPAPAPSAESPAVATPRYWPSGTDWMQQLQLKPPYAFTPYGQGGQFNQDTSAPASRGGAEAEPNLSQPAGAREDFNILNAPPSGQSVEIPTDTDTTSVPGVSPRGVGARPARVPPPVASHVQEEALKKMIKEGPKRSILGTIAGMAAKGAAGYVNAAGRTRPVPIPTQTARDWALRARGGGAWDTKLAQQQQLAEMEQSDTKQAQAAYQLQAQAEERQSMADYYQQHGAAVAEDAITRRMGEADRQKQQALQRITNMGGKTPQIRYFPANSPPPPEVAKSSDWVVDDYPYDKRYKIAVRPDPGEQIDDETAEFLGMSKGTYLPKGQIVGAAKAKVAAANAVAAQSEREKENLRKQLADANTVRHQKVEEGLMAGAEADRQAAREATRQQQEQKQSDAIDQGRTALLNSATTWRNNELDRLKRDGPALGKKPEEEEAAINAEWLRRSQDAYEKWGNAIRRRPGGTAADFKVYPNGSVVQVSEPYGAGGKPVPIGSAEKPPAPPVVPPAQSTGGGRGGRGAPKVPPAVNTATTPTAQAAPQPGKTFDVPTPSGAVIHFPDRETAVKWLAARNAVLTDKQ